VLPDRGVEAQPHCRPTCCSLFRS